jgi:hypothetical protein
MNMAHLPILTRPRTDAAIAVPRSANIIALVAANGELVWDDDGTELRARIAPCLLAGAR